MLTAAYAASLPQQLQSSRRTSPDPNTLTLPLPLALHLTLTLTLTQATPEGGEQRAVASTGTETRPVRPVDGESSGEQEVDSLLGDGDDYTTARDSEPAGPQPTREGRLPPGAAHRARVRFLATPELLTFN